MISRKDMLLEKAKNRTITQTESDELRSILEQEARNAKAVGDFIGFLIIMGLLLFLAYLMKDLLETKKLEILNRHSNKRQTWKFKNE